MSRKIILLSDGTGNSSAKIWRTNVWRIFEALDLSGSDQVAIYDDGVGTSSFVLWAILGGAFGIGLKRNVIDIYKFASRNYRDVGDEIFGFGFSRGAFTIRTVIGLILDQGLIDSNGISDSELDKQAHRAYRSFRQTHFHTNWGIAFRAVKRLLGFTKPGSKPRKQVGTIAAPSIRFLGLWDTVAAYGLPIDEMTRGVNQWIWPLELPTHTLNPKVRRACHALSIDDERTTFHPVLWNERDEPARTGDRRYTRDERISQVWFAGMHANVGGGYPDDSLARIPLYWIMEEARGCGLKFKKPPASDPDAIAQIKAAQDKDGRLYNSRTGFGSYYRYGPRKIAELCRQKFSRSLGDEVYIDCPKIHESVFARIKNNAHVYAPIGIPERYEIVRNIFDGNNASFQILPLSPDLEGTDRDGLYEAASDATARSRSQDLQVWNNVPIRALFYYLTVFVTICLFVYPISGRPDPSAELITPLRWLSDLIRLFGTVLPGSASRWINGYAQHPEIFLLCLVTIVVLTWISGSLGIKITDTMSRLWQTSFAHKLADPDPTASARQLRRRRTFNWVSETWSFALAPALSALFLVYFGAAIASHALYNVFDDAGLVCSASAKIMDVPAEGLRFDFRASDLCRAPGIKLDRTKRYSVTFDQNPTELPAGYQSLPSQCLPNDLAQLQVRGVTATLAGFSTFNNEKAHEITWAQLVTAFFLTPLRRELDRPWLETVVRFGPVGGEESFMDPGGQSDKMLSTTFRPTISGELYVFLNDAVLGIPGLFTAFYRHDHGCITVLIKPK
jgi:uncharacterized protein (DUF2235 family)